MQEKLQCRQSILLYSCYLWHGIRTYRNILYKLLLSITGLQFYIFDSPITKPDQLVFCTSATLHLLTILFSRMHSWIFRPSLVLLALPKSATNSCRILSLFVNLRHDKGGWHGAQVSLGLPLRLSRLEHDCKEHAVPERIS